MVSARPPCYCVRRLREGVSGLLLTTIFDTSPVNFAAVVPLGLLICCMPSDAQAGGARSWAVRRAVPVISATLRGCYSSFVSGGKVHMRAQGECVNCGRLRIPPPLALPLLSCMSSRWLFAHRLRLCTAAQLDRARIAIFIWVGQLLISPLVATWLADP